MKRQLGLVAFGPFPEFSEQLVVTPQFSFQSAVEPWAPGAQVIKSEPSKPPTFRVYPGEGSRVKLWARSEERAVILDTDDLLERSSLVLE